MRYCGIAVGPERHHLCALEEVRVEEPPIRLGAAFYEPGPAARVAEQVRRLESAVVAIASPMRPGDRACDRALERLGVLPLPYTDAGARLYEALSDLGVYAPTGQGPSGAVEDDAFQATRIFETNPEGVFAALQGRRLPARRHPLGVQRRIQELLDDRVLDEGGDLWHRRIDEIEAAAAAACAHRFAVGHAWWVGDPDEGVVVLPGNPATEPFATDGVMPDVARVPLPG